MQFDARTGRGAERQRLRDRTTEHLCDHVMPRLIRGEQPGVSLSFDPEPDQHRTYLARDGSAKAPIEQPRMSLGPISGNAIRLTAVTDTLAVGEGIETCMSAMVVGRPAWSAVSAHNVRNLVLPAVVRDVSILVDSDDAGVGERASRAAAVRWMKEGRRVRLCRAPPGKDFNDVLREGKRP